MSKDNNTITVELDANHLMTLGTVLLSVIIFTTGLYAGMSNIANSLGGTGSKTVTRQEVNPNNVNVDAGASSTEKLTTLAKEAGIKDEAAYKKCVDEKQQESVINTDKADASAAGIQATPGFVIGKVNNGVVSGGYTISGALPFEVFQIVTNAVKSGDKSAVTNYLNANTSYKDYITEGGQVSLNNAPYLGNSNNPVAIVEFSDLECPFCQRHHKEEYPDIISKLVDTGDAVYYFKNLPLSIHEPMATTAANAAMCVKVQSDNEGYFAFLDLYFAKTKSNAQGL